VEHIHVQLHCGSAFVLAFQIPFDEALTPRSANGLLHLQALCYIIGTGSHSFFACLGFDKSYVACSIHFRCVLFSILPAPRISKSSALASKNATSSAKSSTSLLGSPMDSTTDRSRAPLSSMAFITTKDIRMKTKQPRSSSVSVLDLSKQIRSWLTN
jgi:hypothetical protein